MATKNKEITLSDLIAAKSNRKNEMLVEVPKIGKTKAFKLPTRRFAHLSNGVTEAGLDEQIEFYEKLVYESIPIFRAKDLREAYGVTGEPEEVVSEVLDMEQLAEVVNQLMEFYTGDSVDNTKN